MSILVIFVFLVSGLSLAATFTAEDGPDSDFGGFAIAFGAGGLIGSLAQLISSFVGEPGTVITSVSPWGALAAWLVGLAIIPSIYGAVEGFKFLTKFHKMSLEKKQRSKEMVLKRCNDAVSKAARILEARGVDSVALLDAGARITFIVGRTFDEREIMLREGGLEIQTDPTNIVAEANSVFPETDSTAAAAPIATQLAQDIAKAREFITRSEQAIELALAHCLALPSAAAASVSEKGSRPMENLGEELKNLPRVPATAQSPSGLLQSFQSGVVEAEILSTLGADALPESVRDTEFAVASDSASGAVPTSKKTALRG